MKLLIPIFAILIMSGFAGCEGCEGCEEGPGHFLEKQCQISCNGHKHYWEVSTGLATEWTCHCAKAMEPIKP